MGRPGRPVVLKIGGSLLTSPKGYVRSAEEVAALLERGEMPLVVVSAMKGVTDKLLEASKGRLEPLASVKDLYLSTAKELGSPALYRLVAEELSDLERAVRLAPSSGDPVITDHILSYGERLSRIIMTQALDNAGVDSLGIDARAVIVTDGSHGDARIIARLTRERIEGVEALLREGVVPVIEGFVGSSLQGLVTTLGRGGSDYTATSIASILGIEKVYLASDVEGVYTLDPSIEPSARIVRELSVEEAIEASLLGVKGFNKKTFRPVRRSRISVYVGTWGSFKTVIKRSASEYGPKLVGYKTFEGGVKVGIVGRLPGGETINALIKSAGLDGYLREIRLDYKRPVTLLVVETKSVEALLRRVYNLLFGGG